MALQTTWTVRGWNCFTVCHHQSTSSSNSTFDKQWKIGMGLSCFQLQKPSMPLFLDGIFHFTQGLHMPVIRYDVGAFDWVAPIVPPLQASLWLSAGFDCSFELPDTSHCFAGLRSCRDIQTDHICTMSPVKGYAVDNCIKFFNSWDGKDTRCLRTRNKVVDVVEY